MVVIVVTPAGVSSNSYITLDEANDFADADVGEFAEKWRASDDDDEKTRALLRATRDIDRFVGRVVASYDALTPQALVFPRDVDVDAYSIPYIATGVKRATYLQAIYVFTNAPTIDKAASQRARGLTNFAEPNVSGSLATNGDYAFSPALDSVLAEYREGAVVGWIQTT